MHRISEPQIVDAFIRSSTSPWPGSGTATSFSTVVLSPGKYAPCIVVAIAVAIALSIDVSLIASFLPVRGPLRRCNLPAQIPQVFPRLPVLPQEHLALDQTAIPVDARDRPHLLVRQRLAHRASQIGQVFITPRGERNRRLAAL